jgi:long-chain fatty acid transport protein
LELPEIGCNDKIPLIRRIRARSTKIIISCCKTVANNCAMIVQFLFFLRLGAVMPSKTRYIACLLFLIFASNERCLAGGFDQFDQGISLLFDPAKVAVDTTLWYGVPDRRFVSVNGAPETVHFGVDKLLPALSIKFTPFDDAACLAAYRRPFGAWTDYGSNWSQAATSVKAALDVTEYGLTCSYSMQATPGNFRLIGGVTRDFATYHQEALLPDETRPSVDLDGWTTGWRGGVAYEVPAKAIRASVMYYSPLDFSATGTFYQFPGAPAAVPVHAEASMPQTVEALLTVPLTPVWVNTVFVKWADWSIWKRVPVVLSEDAGTGLPTGTELSVLNFYFRDGWTVSDQISHVLTKDLTAYFRLSWDHGVATGWDEYTDSWGGAIGAYYNITKNVEIDGKVGLAILTAGQIDKMAKGGSYNATMPTDTAFTTSINLHYSIN